MSAFGQLADLSSFDGGRSWSANFKPNNNVAVPLIFRSVQEAFDLAGNAGLAGQSQNITVDTLAPAAPSLSLIDDTVNNQEIINGVTLSGTAEANATVEISFSIWADKISFS